MARPEVKHGGRIIKAVFLNNLGKKVGEDDVKSKQIQDPFSGISAYGQTIMLPPLNMDQLVSLAEAHPIHAASIEQKVNDIVASGLQLSPKSDKETDETEQTAIEDWFGSLFEDYTALEVLQAIWNDYETVGWGAMEIARDVTGIVRKCYHVPGHTLRAHRENILFAQMRHGKVVWFKKWNTEGIYYLNSGRRAAEETEVAMASRANEILIFKKPSRRSTWYGIPVYVSGIGHIAMAIAARDFNVKFFDNYREPRHLIVISGLEQDVDEAASDIEAIWQEQLRDSPHKNVVLPISGDATVVIEKLGLPINDMHFSRLMEQMDSEVLVAHRMPPDRLGISMRGFLGGSVAKVVNAIYKDGVVSKGQNILEDRLQRFIDIEFPKSQGKDHTKTTLKYLVDFEDLDITDEGEDTGIAINLAQSNIITLNQARARLGEDRHEAFGEMTLAEYLSKMMPPELAMAAMTGAAGKLGLTQKDMNVEVMRRLERLDEYIEELLTQEPAVARTK